LLVFRERALMSRQKKLLNAASEELLVFQRKGINVKDEKGFKNAAPEVRPTIGPIIGCLP
jgi:hypothetical protein